MTDAERDGLLRAVDEFLSGVEGTEEEIRRAVARVIRERVTRPGAELLARIDAAAVSPEDDEDAVDTPITLPPLRTRVAMVLASVRWAAQDTVRCLGDAVRNALTALQGPAHEK